MGWSWADYLQTPVGVIDLLVERLKREAKERSAMPRSARRRMR
jgi:hypothetical protein